MSQQGQKTQIALCKLVKLGSKTFLLRVISLKVTEQCLHSSNNSTLAISNTDIVWVLLFNPHLQCWGEGGASGFCCGLDFLEAEHSRREEGCVEF